MIAGGLQQPIGSDEPNETQAMWLSVPLRLQNTLFGTWPNSDNGITAIPVSLTVIRNNQAHFSVCSTEKIIEIVYHTPTV